jgi:signal transduction histidine kinase
VNRAFDAVPGGVISLSDDLRILGANAPMGELVGRTPEDLQGASIDVLLSAPSRILMQSHVYPALRANGRVEEVFLTLLGLGGATTPVLFNAVRRTTDDGRRYDALIVRIRARNKWELDLLEATKALQRERASSRELAEELEKALRGLHARVAEDERNRQFRDAFVGVVGHELRTPITTIFGMGHVLRRRHRVMDPETVDRHLDDIVSESDRLRRLTEDLLVLSRAEGGRLALSDDPIVLSHVVRRAVENERERAPGHRFATDIPDQLPLVTGEDMYVEQVLTNFLNNATKYSPPGTTVHVSVAAEGAGVAVRVVDEGPGLREEHPERLFELFYRAKEVVGRKQGAGIGLFVCRELIRAMRGRVWAAPSSSPGEGGAEFGFWLPAATEGADTD